MISLETEEKGWQRNYLLPRNIIALHKAPTSLIFISSCEQLPYGTGMSTAVKIQRQFLAQGLL
jgi:hypothetical protein